MANRLCVACDHDVDIGMRERLERLTQALVSKRDRSTFDTDLCRSKRWPQTTLYACRATTPGSKASRAAQLPTPGVGREGGSLYSGGGRREIALSGTHGTLGGLG
jgi:hypothetical protein